MAKQKFQWVVGYNHQTASADHAGVCLSVRIVRRGRGAAKIAPGAPRMWEWCARWTGNDHDGGAKREVRAHGTIKGSMEEAEREAERHYGFVAYLGAAAEKAPRA